MQTSSALGRSRTFAALASLLSAMICSAQHPACITEELCRCALRACTVASKPPSATAFWMFSWLAAVMSRNAHSAACGRAWNGDGQNEMTSALPVNAKIVYDGWRAKSKETNSKCMLDAF